MEIPALPTTLPSEIVVVLKRAGGVAMVAQSIASIRAGPMVLPTPPREEPRAVPVMTLMTLRLIPLELVEE